MTEEEKKAIEYFTNFTEYTKNRAIEEYNYENKNIKYAQDLEKRAKIFKTALNLIQKQQAEIEKKDKIIDEMAEAMDDIKDPQVCEYCNNNNLYCENEEKCREGIKQYFEKKVRDEDGKN